MNDPRDPYGLARAFLQGAAIGMGLGLMIIVLAIVALVLGN